MLLTTLLRKEYLPSRIEICKGYSEALETTLRKYSAHLGYPATVSDFTEQNILAYLMAYRAEWSARSTNNQRANLITLWMAAFDAGLVDRMPVTRRIRKLKIGRDPPLAWKVDDIGDLLRYCETLSGEFCGIEAALWWRALFGTMYWTGCRIAAMMRTNADCYDRGSGVLVRLQKNKQSQWYPLPTACCDLLDATEPWNRQKLFPYPKYPKTIFVDARRIIEAAGLDCPKHKGLGLFHRVRRTTLSYCAAVDPAIAQRQAAHSSYATTLQSYVDPKIAGQRSAADVLPDPLSDEPIYKSLTFRIYG